MKTKGIEVTEAEVFGFRLALWGMREPMKSHHLADTVFDYVKGAYCPWNHLAPWWSDSIRVPEFPTFGESDKDLMLRLCAGGPPHRKFMRQIHIGGRVLAPIYWWSEMDTYHGDLESWLASSQPVRDSSSTMHKLGKTELTPEDFQDEDINARTLADLNALGKMYREAIALKDHTIAAQLLRQMKKNLPGSFLMSAAYTMNYETALTQFNQRLGHRLPEWTGEEGMRAFIEKLPFMEDLIAVGA